MFETLGNGVSFDNLYFEVGNYLGEHLDGNVSNSLKILFGLWEIWNEERIFFPLCYNDTLHSGTFFYQNMFYSSMHQALNWFCLIVTLFIPRAWKSNCDISLLLFPVLWRSQERKCQKGKKMCESSTKAEVVRLKQIQREGKKVRRIDNILKIMYLWCDGSFITVNSCLSAVRTGPKVGYHLQMRTPKIIYLAPTCFSNSY